MANESVPISISGLAKTYGSFAALKDVSLDVGAGEFLSVLGPSGSGKTTMLMMLAGFVGADRGSIRFGGREVTSLAPHKRDIGMVFQNYALFPHMTVGENVGFSLRYRRISGETASGRIADALKMVHLSGFEGRSINQLSGGQRQRVALARAIVFNPAILLMDEPLSALDKKLREEMQIELRQLQQRLGITTIYVTHDQREALSMSDRIAVMNHGAIEQIGTPSEIYDNPKSLFIAQFMGESQCLRIRTVEGDALLGDRTLRTRGGPLKFGPSEHAFLVVRPEKLVVLKPGESPDEMNVLEGRIASSLFQGESIVLNTELDTGDTVTLRIASNQLARCSLPRPGDRVRLGLHSHDTIILPD